MIYLYDTGRGVIGTNEAGAKQIDAAISRGIEELLTTLHNEPEVVNPISQEELGWGKGIKWQMDNTASYTYSALTKEKFEELIKDLTYGK